MTRTQELYRIKIIATQGIRNELILRRVGLVWPNHDPKQVIVPLLMVLLTAIRNKSLSGNEVKCLTKDDLTAVVPEMMKYFRETGEGLGRLESILKLSAILKFFNHLEVEELQVLETLFYDAFGKLIAISSNDDNYSKYPHVYFPVREIIHDDYTDYAFNGRNLAYKGMHKDYSHLSL